MLLPRLGNYTRNMLRVYALQGHKQSEDGGLMTSQEGTRATGAAFLLFDLLANSTLLPHYPPSLMLLPPFSVRRQTGSPSR